MIAAIEFVLATICVIAAILQIVTARHSSVRHRMLVRAGKRIMAAGFFFMALRLFWLVFSGVQVVGVLWGLVAVALIVWGSLMTTVERVIGE